MDNVEKACMVIPGWKKLDGLVKSAIKEFFYLPLGTYRDGAEEVSKTILDALVELGIFFRSEKAIKEFETLVRQCFV